MEGVMMRGMGSQTAPWLAIAGLVGATLIGCGGATSNQNRNVSRGTVVTTTEPIVLRYAPAPGLRLRRTMQLNAMLDGHHFVIVVVNDETLGPTIADVTRRCVRTELTVDAETAEVPCEGTGSTQARQIVDRFARLGALSVITYPTRPVRVGESWACEGAAPDACAWTFRAIEDSPAGRVAILALRLGTEFRDQHMPAEMTYAVRISDGVPLSAELRGAVQGQLSFQSTWMSETFTN
jgi:hypothetical protein